MSNAHASKLEWIVIWLILIEVTRSLQAEMARRRPVAQSLAPRVQVAIELVWNILIRDVFQLIKPYGYEDD